MKHEEMCSSYKIIFRNKRSVKRIFSTLAVSFMVLCVLNIMASAKTKNWVGTWASAPYKAMTNTAPLDFDNYTLRQIVRVSIGGDTVRVRFSNITSANAVTINSVNIAVSPDGTKSAVDASTITKLTFKGDSSVTIGAKTDTVSDPTAFALKPNARIAITIFYGKYKKSEDMTFHYGSRTNSYYIKDNKTSSPDFSGSTAIERWFTISSVDVLASDSSAAVACFGNSITDGYGLSGGLQNRWTDAFSEKLLANSTTKNVGVLNLGIGATCVTTASNGADAGVDRFTHDVLEQQGVKWVIVFYGVNDINGGTSADSIINGYKKLIAAAHAKNMKVYGATLTPFKGNSYYDAAGAHEKVRQNVNKWIRTAGNFDNFLDFDKIVQDPGNPEQFLAAYKNDGLHPNAAGYKALGESVDLKLFETPVSVNGNVTRKELPDSKVIVSHFNGTDVSFEMPQASFVSLKLYNMLGKEICELAGRNFSSGSHTVNLKSAGIAKGMYLYSLKAGNFSDRQIIIY